MLNKAWFFTMIHKCWNFSFMSTNRSQIPGWNGKIHTQNFLIHQKRISWMGGSSPKNFTIFWKILHFWNYDQLLWKVCEFHDFFAWPTYTFCKFFTTKGYSIQIDKIFSCIKKTNLKFFFFPQDRFTSFTSFSMTKWQIQEWFYIF